MEAGARDTSWSDCSRITIVIMALHSSNWQTDRQTDRQTNRETNPSFIRQTSSIIDARSARDEWDTHFSTTLLHTHRQTYINVAMTLMPLLHTHRHTSTWLWHSCHYYTQTHRHTSTWLWHSCHYYTQTHRHTTTWLWHSCRQQTCQTAMLSVQAVRYVYNGWGQVSLSEKSKTKV